MHRLLSDSIQIVNSSGHSTVYIVDDERRTGDEVKAAVKGLQVKQFESGGEFLRIYDRTLAGCLIVNITLPDMTGIELQDRLLSQYCALPFIFIGSGSSVAQAVKVMRKGAIDFLDRPFQRQDLATAIIAAMDSLDRHQNAHAELADLGARFEQLTSREREVLDAVVSGQSNRSVAEGLGISEKTVETHRLRLMNKMQVKSLASLVRATLRLREFQDGQPVSALVPHRRPNQPV
jgi:FixJ family two-component response regulator